MSLGQRLKLALLRRGLTVSQCAIRLGISQASLSAVITGQRPGWKHLPKLAEMLDVAESWLTTGSPEPAWLADVDPSMIPPKGPPEFDQAQALIHARSAAVIPYIGSVSAADPARPVWVASGAADDAHRPPLKIKSHWRAVRVHGHSAHPIIWDRQTVLVDDQIAVKPGRIVVAQTHTGEAYVKRFVSQTETHLFLAGLDAGQHSVVLPKGETRMAVVIGVLFTDNVAG